MSRYMLVRGLLAGGLILSAGSALAGPETFSTSNITTVNGSDGNAYTAPNNYIGTPYQTTGLSVVENGSTTTFNYYTAFSGTDSVAGYNVGYADIFLAGVGAGYAISLGAQTGNGGVATAGLYSGVSDLSSNQIWGSRSGITYGSGYNGGQTAYTVVTGGTFLEGVTITDTLMGNGQYDLAITLSNMSFDVVQALDNGSLSIFWGTGDCANGAFNAVSEPASYAALIVGVMMIGFISWKRSTNVSA